jgi:hypothetical protein
VGYLFGIVIISDFGAHGGGDCASREGGSARRFI